MPCGTAVPHVQLVAGPDRAMWRSRATCVVVAQPARAMWHGRATSAVVRPDFK